MRYFILTLEIYSVVHLSYGFTTSTRAYSSTTTTARSTCACSEVVDDADKTQCVLDKLFGSLIYFETSKCVSKELTLDVKPWDLDASTKCSGDRPIAVLLRKSDSDIKYEIKLKPITKTVTNYFEGQIDTCQSGQFSNTPRLFINSSSPCGLFRCCIDCTTCFDNTYNILEAEGPVILKADMSDKTSQPNPDRLSVLCYQNDNYIALGSQEVYILFNKDISCGDMEAGDDSQLNSNMTASNTGTPTTAKQSQTEALSEYYQNIINDQMMFPLIVVSAIALAFSLAGMAVNYCLLSRLHKSRLTTPR